MYIYIDKQCDYHQNQVQNKTNPAEKTLIGMINFQKKFYSIKKFYFYT